jgi:hypothetical protein
VNTQPDSPPIDLWRLDTPEARALAVDAGRLDDLQTTLRCCGALLGEVTPAVRAGREAVVEALWLLALTSYVRCFSSGSGAGALTEADVVAAVPDQEEVVQWHRALVRLQAVHADPDANPRETFVTSLLRDDDGSVVAVALTSASLPAVDETSVRAAGGIALALGQLVETRMEHAQEELMTSAGRLTGAELDALEHWQTEGPG